MVTSAVDADFPSVATVEFFGLDFRSGAADLLLLASAPAPDRFYRLSWFRPLASEGEEAEDAMVARPEKHKWPVRGLSFSMLRLHMLASGADEGEVIIRYLRNPSEPAVCGQLKHLLADRKAAVLWAERRKEAEGKGMGRVREEDDS